MKFTRERRINRRTSAVGFAAMMFGMAFLSQLFYGYNLSYYTQLGLIDLAGAGICKIVFTIVDWLDDLIFGALSERTHSRWGKRIPWLVGAMIWMPVFVVLTYAVGPSTGFNPAGFIAYYLLISIFQEFTSTIFYTNYTALFPTLFHTTETRNTASMMKQIMQVVGVCLCFVLTPILADDAHIPYWVIGIGYSVVYIACYIIGLRSINVKDDLDSENRNNNEYSFRQTLKDCMKDAPFIVYCLASSCFSAVLAVIVSLFPLYCTYCLNISGWQQAVTMGALFLTVLAFIPVWYSLNRKIGYIKTWLISYTASTLALLLLLIPHDFVSAIICCVFIGPWLGGLLISPDMIFAEIIDIDKIKHHISREAAVGSVSSLLGRFMIIFSTILTSYVPLAFGYSSGANTGDNPDLAFRVTLGVLIPCILLVGCILAYIYVRISKKQRMALHELKRADTEKTTELDIREIIDETK